MRRAALVLAALRATPAHSVAADAPSAPGQVASWTDGDKDGVGASTSAEAGRPVERPALVACRYALRCR